MTELELISKILDHVEVINDELGEVVSRVAVLETQIASVLWLQRLVLGAIILAVIGAILNLILKKRNAR